MVDLIHGNTCNKKGERKGNNKKNLVTQGIPGKWAELRAKSLAELWVLLLFIFLHPIFFSLVRY